MRKRLSTLVLLAGLSAFACYGQERNAPTLAPKEDSDVPTRSLKSVLQQMQDLYKVNLLFETKLENLTTTYRINPEKDFEQAIRELLAPLQLTFVKLGGKDYVIKPAQGGGGHLNSAEDVPEGDGGVKPRVVERDKTVTPAAEPVAVAALPIVAPTSLDTADKFVTVKGRVTSDETGEPLGFVSVTAGYQYHALADAQGNFTIRIPAAIKTLRFSRVNYETLDVKIKPGVELKVTMKLRSDLAAVTVSTGMFTRRKESFTGATSTFTGDELKVVGNQNIIQSLKTLDPSFIVVDNNAAGSDPNHAASIQIRGTTSLATTALTDRFNSDPNLPLFILDGFAVPLQVVNDLDMNRVASVTILKDAASATMYGAQAANGVVVIETKLPIPGKLRVTYTGDFDLQAPDLNVYNMMNSSEELKFETLAGRYTASSITSYSAQDFLNNLYNAHLSNITKGVNTYWLGVPVQVGVTAGHGLYAETGDSAIRVGFGGNYRVENGVMKGSDRKTYSATMDFSYRKGKMNFSNRFYLSGYSADNSPYGSFSNFVDAPAYYPRVDSVTGKPDRYLEQSVDNQGNAFTVVNPLYTAQLNALYAKNNTVSQNLTNNMSLSYRASQSLMATAGLSVTKATGTNTLFTPPELDAVYNPLLSGTYTSGVTDNTGYQGYLALTYGKLFDRVHRITANVRSDVQQSYSSFLSMEAVGFPLASDGNPTFAYGYAPNAKPNTSYNNFRRNDLIGSANYTYNNRYFVDATWRIDGSTAFGSNQKYKSFYSGGIGWNVNKEGFLKNADWINGLRIRLNTGISSNQAFGNFSSASIYTFDPYAYQAFQGLDLTSIGNPNLQWQITTQTNLGTDWVLFHNRLSLAANVYTKVTNPMVIAVPTPPSTGGGNYAMNAGKTVTKGLDFMARYTIIDKPRQRTFWSVSATGGMSRSVFENFNSTLAMLSKQNQLSNPLQRYANGYSPDDLWAVRSMGIDPGTGQEVFVKKSGAYTFAYDPNDVVRVGSSMPAIQGVVNTQVRWRGILFSASVRYSYGGDIFNSALFNKVENISYASIGYSGSESGTIADNQDKRALYNRWQKPGDVMPFKAIQLINPIATVGSPQGPGAYTSRFIQRQNFLSGESMSLGYDATGQRWVRKAGMQGFRVTVYTNELWRLTTVKAERGTDYPFANTMAGSVGITF